MKIAVFSDLHGSVSAARQVAKIVQRENPDKTVLCGDVFGFNSAHNDEIGKLLSQNCSSLYAVRGNNDVFSEYKSLGIPLEEDYVTYGFGRTLFFTHGHRFNAERIPPFLSGGDVIVYGHTHVGGFMKRLGIYCANVGSVALPRLKVANYLTIEQDGMRLKSLDGATLEFSKFNG